MPKPRKVHYNNAVLFVSSSMEEGLLLPATAVVKLHLESIIARAQELYPVCISAFVFEANHLHMFLVVKNPNDVKDFMRYIKTESSHIINRMLGRQKRTIWCEGYDSPIMCDLNIAIDKLVYIFTNPARDGLERSIDYYPHLSSWQMMLTGRYRKVVPCCLSRDDAPYLGERVYSLYELKKKAKILRRKAEKIKGSYEIAPMAWLEAFGITEVGEQEEIWRGIIDRVYEQEAQYEKVRKDANKGVIGAKILQGAPLDTTYIPERSGRRSVFLSSDRDLRYSFYEGIKQLLERGKEIGRRWLCGDFSEPFPLGLYPPSLPRIVEPIRFGFQLTATY